MLIERLKTLRKNLGQGLLSRAVFSLVLAFLLWGWVTNLDDPEIERSYGNIPLTLIGQRDNLVLLDSGQLPTISATMRGPQSSIDTLNSNNLRATIDLSDIDKPGEHRLEIKVAPLVTMRGVRQTTITPNQVTITLDSLATKTFPLDYDVGQPVPPYSIGTVDYQTRQVEVRGPASRVNLVARVTLPVGLGDRRESFEAQFTPEARDSNGNRVGGVTITPNTVTATVAVERVGRTVSIVPNIVGTLPEGYRVRDTSVSPPSITVDGPAEILSQLIVVSTTPINLNERRESFSVYDVPLALPAGVRLIERNAINVEVRIEAEQQRQQVSVRVAAIADPGLRTTVTPSEIILVLSGSRERLSQLRSDDVRAEIDVRGYTPGNYPLTPRITVPNDLRADPAPTVRVQIDRPATPTIAPTPLPPPTPTPTPTPTQTPLPSAPPSGRVEDGGRRHYPAYA